MRRLVLLLLVPLALLLAQASQSRALDTAATVAITGAAPNYTVVLTGTGSDAIHCMRFFAPPGVTVTVVGAPAGTNTEGASVFSNGSLNIAKGATATWAIKASADLTTTPLPQVHISSDCKADFNATVTVTAGPPKPPPPKGNCKCVGLTVKTSPENFTDDHTFEFAIHWTLKCTGAAGVSGSCRGAVLTIPPRGSDFTIATNKGKALACAGKCGKKNSGTFHIVGHSKRDLKRTNRKGETFVFKFHLTCSIKGKVGADTMTVVFDKRGFLDRKKSRF